MPTKQELMDMMDNHLPGEPVLVQESSSSSSQQPPAYPDLEKESFAEQKFTHNPNRVTSAQVYSIPQPAISHPPTRFGRRSHLAYCPSCHVTQMTRCEYESSMMTHIIAAILCCTTCSCCLPYLFDNCKSSRHYCQNCGTYLGAQNN